ncbi:hypothetical protein Tco_0600896 [Tanacetum coccineum]
MPPQSLIVLILLDQRDALYINHGDMEMKLVQFSIGKPRITDGTCRDSNIHPLNELNQRNLPGEDLKLRGKSYSVSLATDWTRTLLACTSSGA